MEKLKYKVKNNISFTQEFDFLETLLGNVGVVNIPAFLNPKEDYCNDPFLFKNIEQGLELLHLAIENNKRIFLKVDPDADGYTSASYIYQFIKMLNPSISIDYCLNFEKEHGLIYGNIKDIKDIGLIIIPDASFEKDNIEEVRKHTNVPILVLDHHEFEPEMEKYATIINCQDGVYPNNTLSGVGVVHKFVEAYCKKYNLSTNIPKMFIDLVSLGMIADNMKLTNLETRYYVLEGLKDENIHNGVIKELLELFKEDMKFGKTIINMGWVIAPKINACIRYGKEEEQKVLFEGFIGKEEMVEFQPRRKVKTDPKPPIEYHTLQWEAAKICKTVKTRQDTNVRDFMKQLDEKIVNEKLDENSVIFVDGTDILTKKTVTGLVANKLATKYHRPVFVLKSFDDETFGGSARNYSQGSIENLKDWISERGVSGKGHQSSFGIEVPKKNLNKIIKKCNKDLPLKSLDTIYTVDYTIDANKLTEKMISEVAKNYSIWGGDVPEPVFYIYNIKVRACDIKGYGETNSFIRFTYKDIPYLKKYATSGTFEEMTMKSRYSLGVDTRKLKLNIIGTFALEEYENRLIPQIKIECFDVEEDKEEDDFDFFDNAPDVIETKDNKKDVKINKKEEIKIITQEKKREEKEEDELDTLFNNGKVKKKANIDIDDDFIF